MAIATSFNAILINLYVVNVMQPLEIQRCKFEAYAFSIIIHILKIDDL